MLFLFLTSIQILYGLNYFEIPHSKS